MVTETAAPDLRAAAVFSCTIVAGALAADVALIRRGLRDPERPVGLISDVARHPAGVAFLVVFGLHLAGALGRFDPFRLLGAAASWRRPLVRCHVP